MKSHELVQGIISSLYSFDNITRSQLYAHLGELQFLKKHFQIGDHSRVTGICDHVQEKFALASSAKSSMSHEERLRMLAACDELRLHLIASALANAIAKAVESKDREQTIQRLGKTLPVITGVVQGRGNLTHAIIADMRIMVLPRIKNDSQCDEIYEEFLAILDQSAPTESWVIDFSLLEELPLLLLANLIVYSKKIRETGHDCHLCWVKPSFFTPAQLGRVTSYFNLVKFGDYYFSKATPHHNCK